MKLEASDIIEAIKSATPEELTEIRILLAMAGVMTYPSPFPMPYPVPYPMPVPVLPPHPVPMYPQWTGPHWVGPAQLPYGNY